LSKELKEIGSSILEIRTRYRIRSSGEKWKYPIGSLSVILRISGVASAVIPLLGKGKSQGVITIGLSDYCMSILWTSGCLRFPPSLHSIRFRFALPGTDALLLE